MAENIRLSFRHDLVRPYKSYDASVAFSGMKRIPLSPTRSACTARSGQSCMPCLWRTPATGLSASGTAWVPVVSRSFILFA